MPQMAEETRVPVEMDAPPLVQAAAALRPVIRSAAVHRPRHRRFPPRCCGIARRYPLT
jgi:hypothetical protein